jgi:hypothetical protein
MIERRKSTFLTIGARATMNISQGAGWKNKVDFYCNKIKRGSFKPERYGQPSQNMSEL